MTGGRLGQEDSQLGQLQLGSAASDGQDVTVSGQLAVTVELGAAVPGRERSAAGHLTTGLAPTGQLTVDTSRPVRQVVVVIPPRLPVTVTVPVREVTVAMPSREPITLMVRPGSPPAVRRPSFAVRDAAGSYR